MALYGLFNEARRVGRVGQIESPLFYPPRLTPEQCQQLPWTEFITGLRPFSEISIGENLIMALVDKTTLWSPGDFCGFIGGKRDIVTLADFTVEEGMRFLHILRQLAVGLQNVANIHRDQYGKVNIAFGFNPEDYQLGAHSIWRMHTHIFIPDHWLAEGATGFTGLRQEVNWRDLNWFDRLKFVEPFNMIYFDFIQYWIKQNPEMHDYLGDPVEHPIGFISFKLANDNLFPDCFSSIQKFYLALKDEYKKVEHVFTNREIDPATGRFMPREFNVLQELLQSYIAQSDWLSARSIRILKHLSQFIERAKLRDGKVISSSDQAWFTKGFAGTFMFSFDRSNKIDLYFSPRVITTSAPEKDVYGADRPTNIIRTELPPDPFQQLEYQKILLAAMSVVTEFNLAD